MVEWMKRNQQTRLRKIRQPRERKCSEGCCERQEKEPMFESEGRPGYLAQCLGWFRHVISKLSGISLGVIYMKQLHVVCITEQE